MEPIWENPEKMNDLLGLEGSRETYDQLQEVITKLEVQFVNGKVFASYNQNFPIIGCKLELNFLDPNSGLIIDHKISVYFQEKNDPS